MTLDERRLWIRSLQVGDQVALRELTPLRYDTRVVTVTQISDEGIQAGGHMFDSCGNAGKSMCLLPLTLELKRQLKEVTERVVMTMLLCRSCGITPPLRIEDSQLPPQFAAWEELEQLWKQQRLEPGRLYLTWESMLREAGNLEHGLTDETRKRMRTLLGLEESLPVEVSTDGS